MTRNGNGPHRLTKGLFVGGLLGAAVGLLYALKGGMELRSEISQEGIQSERRHRPFFTSRAEEFIVTGKSGKAGIGWLATFLVASVVAMIADVRIKKT